MNHAIETGLSFGLTSGVITTLGLMVGLQSSTQSKLVVIGGILTIAIADAFSDALGIHISEESENTHSHKAIWEATIAAFVFKFVAASIFLIPVILLDLTLAVWVSVGVGLGLLFGLSYIVAIQEKAQPLSTALKHVLIAAVVVLASHYIGQGINSLFKG